VTVVLGLVGVYIFVVDRPHPLKYGGGPVEHNPDIRVIYWGPKWLQSKTNPIKAAVARFFRRLPGSNYQNITAQYWDKTGKVGLDPKLVATYVDGTSPTGLVTRVQVAYEIRKIARLKGWPLGVNQQYVVLGEQGARTDDTSDHDCGYHTFSPNRGKPYPFAFLPYEGNNNCAGTGKASVVTLTTDALSHETAETMTDPLLTAWKTDQGVEIADVCNAVNGTLGTKGVTTSVKGLWNLSGHTCTTNLPRSVEEDLTVTPVSSHTRGVYNLDAQVQFSAFIPGDSATVILRGVGYDMRRARIATTPGCTEQSAIDSRGGFRYQFACHSGRIDIEARVRPGTASYPPVQRDAILDVSLSHNGVALGIKQSPLGCTESFVWQPKYSKGALVGLPTKPARCL
jgi:hypothetical protein